MENKILFIIGIVLVFVALGFLIMKPKTEMTGETIVIDKEIMEEVVSESEESDEINNTIEDIELINEIESAYLHFNKINITFAFSGFDFPVKKERMRNAFEELEKKVAEFNFTEIEIYDDADIKILLPRSNNLNTLAEAAPILNGNGEITGGEITIIKIDIECDYHGTEMHELLHVFGFDHKPGTVMDRYSDECGYMSTKGNMYYIDHLKFIYSNGERGKEHTELPMAFQYEYKSECGDGLYETLDGEYCCQEPDMIVDDEGYCDY